jgi:hypothetical protein
MDEMLHPDGSEEEARASANANPFPLGAPGEQPPECQQN